MGPAESTQIAGKEPALTDPDDRHPVIIPPKPHQRPRQQRAHADESAIPAIEQLAAFFNGSAALIADDALARAGLRLTTEAGLDTAPTAFRKWMELVSRLVDTAIADGQLPASAAQRLAVNLCAGFIGAIQVIQVLGDPGDFASRIDDLVNAYLISDA